MAEFLLPGSIIAAVAALALLHLVSQDTGWPNAYGAVGVLIALFSAAWWPSISVWWTLPVVATALVLFLIGRKADKKVDQWWYYAALAVGILGKTLAFGLVYVSGFLGSEAGVPMVILIVGIVATAMWLWVGVRRVWARRAQRREPEPAPS